MTDEITTIKEQKKEQEKEEILKKIKLEKRKRHQAYVALDYFSSLLTYFDFFSVDAFKIITHAKYLGANAKQQITSEFLLASYLLGNSKILEFLPQNELRTNFENLFFTNFNIQSSKKKQKSLSIFGQKNNLENEYCYFTQNQYSHEVNQLFEKAVENALNRFKTPVITAEILFVTMMEEKTSRVGKFIEILFFDEMDWYLFRYKLIKHIHNQESKIRSEVSKNQQYFGYLLKTQLPDCEFTRLIEKKELEKGVLQFRNTLILNLLQRNIFDFLTEELTVSIRINNKRNYSS